MGEGQQREPQRVDQAVRSQGDVHEEFDTGTMRSDSAFTEHAPPQKTWLQNPGDDAWTSVRGVALGT